MSKKITNILIGNVGRKFNEWQTAIATLKEYQELYAETESELELSEKIMSIDGDGDGTSDYGMQGLVLTTQQLHEKIDGAYDSVLEGYDDYKAYRETFKDAWDAYDYHLFGNGYAGDDAATIDEALTVADGIMPKDEDGKTELGPHDKMILIVTNYDTQDGYSQEVLAQKSQAKSLKTYETKANNATQQYLFNVDEITDWELTPYVSVYANLDVRIRKNLHDVYYYTNLLSDNMLKAKNLMYNVIQPEIDEAQKKVDETKQAFKDICPIYFENESDSSISDAISEIARINKLVMQKYAELSQDADDIKRDFEVLLNTETEKEDPALDVKFTQFELDDDVMTLIVGSQGTISYKFMNDNNVEVDPTNNAVEFKLMSEDNDSSDDSSDDAVVSVDENGVVKAIAKGTAVISVKPDGLVAAAKELTVNVVETKINGSPSSETIEVYKGKSANFDFTTDPKSEIAISSVESEDDSVAIMKTTDTKGVYMIYGIAAGSTHITVTLTSGDIISVPVKVIVVEATNIYLNSEDSTSKDIQLVAGEEGTNVAIKLNPEDATDEVNVTIDDESIAKFTDSDASDNYIGIVGLSAGTTKLTATTESGVSSTVNINVEGEESKLT